MAIISKLFITTCAFFSALVRCDGAQDKFLRRDSGLVERSGNQWEAQLFLRNESEQIYQTPFNPLLDSRSLLESWMGKRQETCVNAGYSPCSDGSGCCPTNGYGCCPLGCCPTGKNCCTTSNTCADPGDVCCDGGYTCPSGWKCCTEGTCYPDGGQCCSTGYYCTAGNICVLVDGVQKCCTDNTCTAHVSGTVTISAPSLPTNTDNTLSNAPSPTTAAPSQATLSVIYTYYYYTITYYYISWYWTIFLQQSESTYTTITTYTTVSIYETNSEAAYSSFLDVSETLSLETPAAASTLSPLPSSTTSTSLRAGGGVTATLPSINTSLHAGSEPTTTTTTGSSQSSPTVQAAGNGAVGLRAGLGGGGKGWVAGLVGVWVGVGGLMVWL